MKKLTLTLTFILVVCSNIFAQSTFSILFPNSYGGPNDYNITETDSFYVFSMASSGFLNIAKNGLSMNNNHGFAGSWAFCNNAQILQNNNFIFVYNNIGQIGTNLVSINYSNDSISLSKI